MIKPDFPPLLAPGYHRFNLDGIKRLCVDPFPAVQSRRFLFLHLEQIIQDLLIAKIPCKIWMDGSLLTEHPDPDDLDIIINIDYDVSQSFSKGQRELVDSLNKKGYHSPNVDSWVFVSLLRDDELFSDNQGERQGYAELYNLEHSRQWLKGVAVITLGETDVGLRISA